MYLQRNLSPRCELCHELADYLRADLLDSRSLRLAAGDRILEATKSWTSS